VWTIRESRIRKQQIKTLGKIIHRDDFAGVIDYALAFTLAHHDKERTMFVTREYEEAQEEAKRTGKPIWKSEDGYYAVADSFEFAETGDSEQWTEIE